MDNVLKIFNVRSIAGKGINILSCGKMTAGDRHSAIPKMYPNPSLTFVLRGRGNVCCRNKKYSIGEGEGFLISEDEIVSYSADPENPWEYIFVILNGADCNVLFSQMHISGENPCFHFPLDEIMLDHLERMLFAGENDHNGGYSVTAYFYLIVSRLIEPDADTASHSQYLEEAVSFMENNYHNSVTVSDIADYIHIDRSYLYRLFMKNYKKSPKRYLEEYRLSKAVAMLEQTDTSICDVAASTGYYDRAHFDRAFYTKFGITPSAWRKQHQSNSYDSVYLQQEEK